jgi:hypothetical protein
MSDPTVHPIGAGSRVLGIVCRITTVAQTTIARAHMTGRHSMVIIVRTTAASSRRTHTRAMRIVVRTAATIRTTAAG